MDQVIVYITGFRQHAGKTVTSLGLAMLLSEMVDPSRIGYIKPVGQRSMRIPNGTLVDEDALVINMFSGIPDIDMETISPVRLEAGFTKRYLVSEDRNRETLSLVDAIERSVRSMAHKEIIIAEGTGHPGVGAIVGLSNARVANLLGARTIFLSGGGIGKALDMLEVDLSYFYHMGACVCGILFNRLIPDKIEEMRKYVTEDFLSTHFKSTSGSLSILGFLPQVDELSNPSMKALAREFAFVSESSPRSSGSARDSLPVIQIGDPDAPSWKIPCGNIRVVTAIERLLGKKKSVSSHDLVIVSAGNEIALTDIINESDLLSERGEAPVAGILIADSGDISLDARIRQRIEQSRIPVIALQDDTATIEKKVLDIFENTKLQVFDSIKAKEIRELFRTHFDLDKFISLYGIKI
jgi:dethiobiotin synthetase